VKRVVGRKRVQAHNGMTRHLLRVPGRWRALIVPALVACAVSVSACSATLTNPSHQDGYYWYRAKGVDTIKALQRTGDSLALACTVEVKYAMPAGENSGDWVNGCVYAGHGGTLNP